MPAPAPSPPPAAPPPAAAAPAVEPEAPTEKAAAPEQSGDAPTGVTRIDAAQSVADSEREFERGRAAARAAAAEVGMANAAIMSKSGTSGFLPLPVLFYGPETDLGFGAFGMFFFRPPNTRTSSINASATGTTRGQVLAEVRPDLWLYQNLLHLEAGVAVRYFPDTFFGIGNHTPPKFSQPFTERTFQGSTAAAVRVASAIYVGVQGLVDARENTDIEPGSPLTRVEGATGGLYLGGGPFVSYDDRDSTYAASRGTFAQVGYQFFPRELGGDFHFSSLRADFRHFIPLGEQVLAFQAVGQLTSGTTPFYALPRIGGPQLRGVRLGRFRDNDMVEAQAEFRFPIFGRFGGTTFVGVGQVARTVADLSFSELKPAGGLGLRYAIVPSEKINIRLDFAYSELGLAYYLDLAEAF